MKISKNTLNILSSFTLLNPSIRIKVGNILASTNVGVENGLPVPIKTVLVRAEIEENFPMEVCIYNLKQFIQIVSTFGEPDFEFTEEHLIISEGNKSINYAYCRPNSIIYPKTDSLAMSTEDFVASFILDAKTLVGLKKMSGIVKNEDLYIKSDEEFNIELILRNESDLSNEYKVLIEKPVEDEFEFKVSMKNIMYIDADTDYIVKLLRDENADVVYFEGIDKKIFYYIAIKP